MPIPVEKPVPEQKFRVQFDFSQEALRELDTLRENMGAASRAEVIRYSLRTLQWVLQQVRTNSTILVETNGRSREVVFPFMQVSASSDKIVAGASA